MSDPRYELGPPDSEEPAVTWSQTITIYDAEKIHLLLALHKAAADAVRLASSSVSPETEPDPPAGRRRADGPR